MMMTIALPSSGGGVANHGGWSPWQRGVCLARLQNLDLNTVTLEFVGLKNWQGS